MKQLTVLLDNRPGALADVSNALGARGVNIESLSCDSVEEHGVLRLTVDRYNEALIALRDAGFQAISEEALVLRLKDEPGALARAALRFKEAGVSIQSMRILKREEGFTLVSLVTDDNERAQGISAEFLVGTSLLPPH